MMLAASPIGATPIASPPKIIVPVAGGGGTFKAAFATVNVVSMQGR